MLDKVNAKIWDANLKYKVGDLVIDDGGYYYNITGKNGKPSTSSNWIYEGAVTANSTGSKLFTSDIPVKLDPGKSFGKFVNGDVIPATGKDSNDVIIMANSQQIPPVYTAPTAGINGTSNTDIETGTTLSITVNGTFTQNDGGAKTSEKIFKNNSQVATLNTYTESIKLSSAVTFRYEASYSQGAIKNDNNGDPYPTGRIPAGTAVSPNRVYTPVLKRFFGPGAAGLTDYRSLNSVFDNTSLTWILNTGTVFKDYYYLIPVGRSVVSIIDLDALNLNITNLFTVTNVNVLDAGGDNQPFKLVKLTNDNPYPSNHRFQITIS